MALDDIVERNPLFEEIITRPLTRHNILGTLGTEQLQGLVRYAWETRWKSSRAMPELVDGEDVQELLGRGIYSALGLDGQSSAALLRQSLPGYGELTPEKMEYYLNEEGAGVRRVLSTAFFKGKRRSSNFKLLLERIWETQWKEEKRIPENITGEDLRRLLGIQMYDCARFHRSGLHGFLASNFEGFGILDDKKLPAYLAAEGRRARDLLDAFFTGKRAKENAKRLFAYLWEHEWKPVGIPMPECVETDRIPARASLSERLGLGRNKPLRALEECVEGYGVLTEEKASLLVSRYRTMSYPTRVRMNSTFFSERNQRRTENAENYLAALELQMKKRRSDLGYPEYSTLPAGVQRVLGLKSTEDLRQARPPEERRYNLELVRWTEEMKQILYGFVNGMEFPSAGLRKQADQVWDMLGITPLAAMRAAERFGFITKESRLGGRPSGFFPHHPLVEFEGYPFREYALRTAADIERQSEIDAHLYLPAHHQMFHVALPIAHRPSLNEYSEKERRIILAVAAYLANPNDFQKEEAIVGGQHVVWQYHAPETVSIHPRITPINAGGLTLTELFLPVRYSADRGGVQTAVLNTGEEAIYLFRHEDHGRLLRVA
ncbi:MAG: hypothetical protein Q7S65_04745 [Nanoarchaeota archaeon]|nr:hypothetical protein [Nanoarchaeota archaeon]